MAAGNFRGSAEPNGGGSEKRFSSLVFPSPSSSFHSTLSIFARRRGEKEIMLKFRGRFVKNKKSRGVF